MRETDPDEGTVAAESTIPRNEDDDYTEAAANRRREFLTEQTGVELGNVGSYSFDPAVVEGNIENFIGVAQVPIGIAGPMRVEGEHASGMFPIPMATTEGAVVASYNRGMKACNQSGGVRTTITGDAISRGPVFEFRSGREAAQFCEWLEDNVSVVREQAEATSDHVTLQRIETYPYNQNAFTNFYFETGDAAGQNMIATATSAACGWILSKYPDSGAVRGFRMAGNTAGEKRSTALALTEGRGKQVTAEITVPAETVESVLNVSPTAFAHTSRLGTLGAFLTGASSTAGQVANGIAALFIATGQDEANVVEAASASLYSEVTKSGNLYVSLTLPALVTATVGGGTHLPTQRECLKLIGCLGDGTVEKFTEIVAATALAGDLSLVAAIAASDWIDAHESLGRNPT